MTEWASGIVTGWGPFGVALLMLLETVFPPIPSELVLPLAGHATAQGDVGFLGVVLGATVGATLGALALYWLGMWVGRERLEAFVQRHGEWLTVEPKELDRAQRWFSAHRRSTVFLGRLVPGVRSLVSIPAGVDRMPLPSFLLFTALGSGLWSTLLAGLGRWLGERHDVVGRWLDPVVPALLGLLLVVYLVRLVRTRRRRRAREGS